MRRIALGLILTLIVLMGPAGMPQLSAQDVQVSIPTLITVIIPNDKTVDASKITKIQFDNRWGGNPNRQEKILVKNVITNSFKVERRTDNGHAGSGIVYTINYSIETNNNTVVKFQATDH